MIAAASMVGLMLGTSISSAFAADMPAHMHKAIATPGHPVTLQGTGVATAHGKGKVHYQVTDAKIRIAGGGVVGIKGTPEVNVKGFGGKFQSGEWTYYFGEGVLTANGNNFALSGWGRFDTEARGSGRVTYRGKWIVMYTSLILTSNNISDELPVNLADEAGPDANLD